MKSIIFKFEEHKYVYLSVYEVYQQFYSFKQPQGSTLSEYFHQFQNRVNVLEQKGGVIGNEKLFIDHDVYADIEEPSEEDLEEAQKRCKEKFLGYAFIAKADHDRFSKLKEELQNEYLKGQDNYPNSAVEAYHMLTNCKLPSKSTSTSSTGVSFAQGSKKR